MKKFLIKTFFVLVLFYVIFFFLEKSLDFLLANENSCQSNTWYKIYNGKINSDVVILGTSRAEVHYDPRVILKETGLKTFNLGLSGTHYNLFSIRWNSYINNNPPPKILIADIDAGALSHQKEIYGKFQYLPYFYKEEYSRVAKEIDQDYYYEKLIPLYKYRGYEMSIVKQLKSNYDHKNCDKNFNGYIEHDINWIERDYLKLLNILKNKPLKDTSNYDFKEGLKLLKQIIIFSKKNNIRLIFTTSPVYYEALGIDVDRNFRFKKVVEKLSKKNKIEWYDFSDCKLSKRKENFYNSSHLNKRGAEQYSKMISEIITSNPDDSIKK